MELWASHVLALGEGSSDVVGDMWKPSMVYPAQPSLSSRGEREQSNLYSGRQTGMLSEYNYVC